MTIHISRKQLIKVGAATLALRPTAVQASGEVVRIGTTATDPYFEPFIGLDHGFFERAPINAEITQFSNTGATVQAAVAGAIDVGLGDVLQIATAVLHGFPFAFFAGGGRYSSAVPNYALCTLANSRFRTAKDLEGQVIAVVVLRSMIEASVREWLGDNGADVSKITFYELPNPEMVAALQRGTVAAAFMVEPFLSQAKAQVQVIGKCHDSIAPSFYISAWFASRAWLARNATVALRLKQAIYESARWANDHQTDTAAILAKHSKLDYDVIRTMKRTLFATSLDISGLQPVLDVAAKQHFLVSPMDAHTLVASARV
jgi:NitT/TauT family transport system substrate-binding protein